MNNEERNMVSCTSVKVHYTRNSVTCTIVSVLWFVFIHEITIYNNKLYMKPHYVSSLSI